MSWPLFKEKIKQYLRPAGDGIFTVSTGKEKKDFIQQKIFGVTGPVVLEKWQKSFDSLPLGPSVVMLGICSDTGGGILRGASWGPLAIREVLADEFQTLPFFDMGDVRCVPHFLLDEYLSDSILKKCRKSLYQDELSPLPVSPLSIAEDFAYEFHRLFPYKKIFTLGGDHSVSYPMVSQYLKAKKNQNKNTAIIHFDAHTDLSVERLGVPVTFGSWVYQILGELSSPENLVQIGIRSSAKSKDYWENTLGIKQYWAQEINDENLAEISTHIINHLKNQKIDELYITLDIDALDAKYASATGTPEAGGMSPHQILFILQALYEAFPFTGADLTEVAPFISHHNSYQKFEPENTLNHAKVFASFLICALHLPYGHS